MIRLLSHVCSKSVTLTVVWARSRWRERPHGRTSPGFSLFFFVTPLSLHKPTFVSVVAVSGQYCTVEEYVDAKYDLHIFKLGDHYRAMM